MSLGHKIFLSFILVIAAIIALFAFFRPPLIYNETLILNVPDSYVELYGKHQVGQVLMPKFTKLCKLGFFIFRDRPKHAQLILHIKPSIDSKEELLRLEVSGGDIYGRRYPFKLPPLHTRKGSIYFFEFNPLIYQTGKPLYFYLESGDSQADNPIRVGCWTNIFFRGNAGGLTYFDNVPLEKHLAFQDFYKFDETPRQVLKAMAKRLLRDPAFLVFYLGLCLILICGIFIINHQEGYL